MSETSTSRLNAARSTRRTTQDAPLSETSIFAEAAVSSQTCLAYVRVLVICNSSPTLLMMLTYKLS